MMPVFDVDELFSLRNDMMISRFRVGTEDFAYYLRVGSMSGVFNLLVIQGLPLE